MDKDNPKKKTDNLTPFNKFSEKIISLNLKKRKKRNSNDNSVARSPSPNRFAIDDLDDLTVEEGSKSYIDDNEVNNNSHIESMEKNQNDLMTLLAQLKSQNSILKKSTSSNINVNIMNNKFKFSFDGNKEKKKPPKKSISKNENNIEVVNKDELSFRNQHDNKKNNYLKESTEPNHENDKNVKDLLQKELEDKNKLIQEQQQREKEQREQIEKELREKIEREQKEKIEKEIKEKIEREYREKIEKEEREKVEREQKEIAEREKELKEKLENELKEKERIKRELEEKLEREREERERIERELKEKHEKEERERIEREEREEREKHEKEEKEKREKLEQERKEREEKEKKEKELLEKKLEEEQKINFEKEQSLKIDTQKIENEQKETKTNTFINPLSDKNPIVSSLESQPFEIEEIDDDFQPSCQTNEKFNNLQTHISSGRLSPDSRKNTLSKRSEISNDKKEDSSIKNVINTFLNPEKKEDTSRHVESEEIEKVNPKEKEIERVKARREKERKELLEAQNKIQSSHESMKKDPEPKKIIPQIEDVGKILTSSKTYNETTHLTIDKSKFSEISKIDLKEKPYLQNSKDPPYGYLLQRRRKAFFDQSYFGEYILKEKNIIEQIKKITQNYQDILEESLKQFEQEKPFNSIFNSVMGHDNNYKEEISQQLKVKSILANTHNDSIISNSQNVNPKMIGLIEPMENLAIYYSLSLNDSSAFKSLLQHFNYWRKVETDGDSFYRTFMFSLLEYFIFTKNIHEIQKIILAITRLSDDDILSGEQAVDFKKILVIFYFIYEQITKGNFMNAYQIMLNAYELEDHSFDNVMTIYCRYAIYCNVDHLYNIYIRPKNSPYAGENSSREHRSSEPSSIDKVSPSTIIKIGYEPLKIVFSAIPFVFNVNLEIIALDGGLSQKGNNIKVLYSKFTDYSVNDIPVISIGYFLSSYHKIYTKTFQNKILKSPCSEFFEDNFFSEKGGALREVYIDNKEEHSTCEKCNSQRKMIYLPRRLLSACGQCFLKDIEQILKVRATDFAKEKYNNIECKNKYYL